MFRRFALLVVPALVLAVLVIAAAAPADATPPPSHPLPLGKLTDTLYDPSDQVVFYSGVANTFINDGFGGGVAVSKADGTSAAVIAGTTDANSLAIGPDGSIYATENDGHIVAISSTTLKVTATYSTGTALCPFDLAFAGATLWFSYTCAAESPFAGLASLNLSTSTVTPSLTSSGSSLLRSIPGHSDELIATQVSTSSIALLSISGTTATISTSQSGVSISDVAVSADGTTAVAQGSTTVAYSVSDLTPITVTNPISGCGGAVAFQATGGDYAASVGCPGDPDLVETFSGPGSAPIRTYDTSTPGSAGQGQTTIPSRRGLTWADGTLLAVYEDYGAAYPTVNILADATVAPSSVTLTGPSTSVRTHLLTLTGTLTSNGVPVAGNVIHVSRTNMDGTSSLASVLTDATGHFTINDSPSVGGTVTYTATSTADAAHASATKSFTVTVSRSTPTVTITTDHTDYAYHGIIHVTGYLGKTYKNRTLTIYYTQYGHSKATLHANAKVDSTGHLTASFEGFVATSVYVTFPGDEVYSPLTVGKRIYVAAYESSAIAGYYKRSGSYYVFHQSDGGAIAARVYPNVVVPDRHVWFVMQVYKSGKWVSATPNFEAFTDSSGIAGVAYDGKTGYHLRIRAEFHGDAANLAKTGGWWYLEFT